MLLAGTARKHPRAQQRRSSALHRVGHRAAPTLSSIQEALSRAALSLLATPSSRVSTSPNKEVPAQHCNMNNRTNIACKVWVSRVTTAHWRDNIWRAGVAASLPSPAGSIVTRRCRHRRRHLRRALLPQCAGLLQLPALPRPSRPSTALRPRPRGAASLSERRPRHCTSRHILQRKTGVISVDLFLEDANPSCRCQHRSGWPAQVYRHMLRGNTFEDGRRLLQSSVALLLPASFAVHLRRGDGCPGLHRIAAEPPRL